MVLRCGARFFSFVLFWCPPTLVSRFLEPTPAAASHTLWWALVPKCVMCVGASACGVCTFDTFHLCVRHRRNLRGSSPGVRGGNHIDLFLF